MGDDDTTTVKLKRDTWKELNGQKEPGDSFDDVIRRLLEQSEEDDTDPNPKATASS